MFDVDESGLFDVRAATRYWLQYDAWHRWLPPRFSLCVPVGGPSGSTRVAGESSACHEVLHQSAHHSQTLPATSYNPNPFGANERTGAVAR